MEQSFDTVSVIGLGYIGLPTATMFATSGKRVIGVDINQHAVDTINSGRTHIVEPMLGELVEAAIANGSLRATMSPEPADAFVIAVPTPVDHDSKAPDTSYVEAAGRALAPVLRPGNLIVLESTSPVGTTRELARTLAKIRPDLRFPLEGVADPDIHLAYCPERIIPGRMLTELVENDRIIGGMSQKCSDAAVGLYGAFVKGACLKSDDRTAELCKLAENSFRDVNIAFANELSMICGDAGIDAWRVIELANHHPRVNILAPGPGVGGHCIAVDPWFIVAGAPKLARIIRMAREVNDAKPEYVMAQAAEAIAAVPAARVVCLGLTYKPDVDDFRESPALHIASMLSKRYPGQVKCIDPFQDMMANPGPDVDSIVLGEMGDLASADVVVMLVGHSQFRALPRPAVHVIDTIGFWR